MVRKLVKKVEADALSILAADADKMHGEIVEGLTAALNKARELGELLYYVKDNWGADFPTFLAARPFSERTARDYMRVSRFWAEISAKWQSIAAPNARLSINKALELISTAPKTEETGGKIIRVDGEDSTKTLAKRREFRDRLEKDETKSLQILCERNGLKGRAAQVLDLLCDLGFAIDNVREAIKGMNKPAKAKGKPVRVSPGRIGLEEEAVG